MFLCFFNYSINSNKSTSFNYYLNEYVKLNHQKVGLIKNSQCLELPELLTNHNEKNKEVTDETKFKTIEKARENFKFMLFPSSIVDRLDEIKDSSIAVVHMVKSSSNNINRRNTIRSTWGGLSEIKFKKSSSYHFLVFIVGTNSNYEALKKEAEEFGDMLIVDISDTAKNVPLKVLAGMQFTSQYLKPHHFYTSIDDDVIVNPLNLHLLLQHMTSYNDESVYRPCYEHLPIVCIYSYQQKDIPARNPKSKWYISYDLFGGEIWPPYCRGGLYLMPVSMTSALYNVSRTTSYMHLDDVWITGIMRRRIGKGDTNIYAAPYSKRTDEELQYNTDSLLLNNTLMKHLWGNIHDMNVNVEEEMKNEWEKLNIAFELKQ